MYTNKKTYAYTTQATVRAAFWAEHPRFKQRRGWSQNDYPTDTRCAFVDYVDNLARDGLISAELAQMVTL